MKTYRIVVFDTTESPNHQIRDIWEFEIGRRANGDFDKATQDFFEEMMHCAQEDNTRVELCFVKETP